MTKADATLHYHKRSDQEASATSIGQLTQALQRKDLELRSLISAAAAVAEGVATQDQLQRREPSLAGIPKGRA